MNYKVRAVHGKGRVLRYEIVSTTKSSKKNFESIEEATKHKEYLEQRKKSRDKINEIKLDKYRKIDEEIDQVLAKIYEEFGVEVRFLNRPISAIEAEELYYKIKVSDSRDIRL